MWQRGFSLIETVVVIAILSVLAVIAVPAFSRLLTHYRMESQTRALLADLQQVRADALYQRRATRVKFSPARYDIYSSAADNSPEPLRSCLLRFPVQCEKNYVDFDQRGLANQDFSICVDSAGPTGALDSVVISSTRLSIGQRDLGYDCKSACITKR
ncbi:hypothetical protein GMLC_04150 [Geomonas limicola]|uniref:Type IV pilus minor pilin FimU n=1 Tax=Geomonas limicola TaxID=2740186 RepID=A0A6V8N2V7_9BACT|nr:prepilin-type N-terminal cleavage/methylation domain-containing protein [Geomonas limicola]GFO66836.1 hypothetical protein GMLC_04150 [Geomonas limicola]